MFYTYVLFSENDKNFYIGFTKDLKKRFDEHSLIYYEACLNEDDAIRREKYFKSGFGRRFLRNRIGTYLRGIC